MAIRLARDLLRVVPDDGEVAGLLALNRAVALAMVEGPSAGLDLLDTLATDDRFNTTHRLESVRAHCSR